jgi:hypothetical protein
MNKNKIQYLSIALTIFLSVGACTDNFEEINTNPNGPVSVPSTLLIASIAETTQDRMNSVFVGGDMGACWAQLWGKVQYNDEERYNPRGSVIDAIWQDLYARALQDASAMYTEAIAEENENLQGVALVLSAYSYHVLTDMYGDVPLKEALQAETGVNSPAYTFQAEIYDSLFLMLDKANSLLSSAGGAISAESDIIYQGDWSSWKKFANSLKFRCLMRISDRSDFNRQGELQEIINNRMIFTSNDDEAKLVYLSASPNQNPVHGSVIAGNRGEYKVGEKAVEFFQGDPRLSVIAQLNADGIYRGKPAGYLDLPSADWNYDNVSPLGELYLAPEYPGYFVSFAEQEFLIAEAMVRGLISGNAQAHFIAGIAASMKANGLTEAEFSSYIAERGSNVTRETIALEKWKSLFGQGVEAWIEWKRFNYPPLDPAVEGAYDEIPSRYTYPSSEQSLNNTNYTEAVSSQGDDLLTTKIWWNK